MIYDSLIKSDITSHNSCNIGVSVLNKVESNIFIAFHNIA